MNDINKNIGNNIREIRKSRHLTLSQVADQYSELSGEIISGGLVGAWERAEKRVSASQLFYIAKVLNCTINSLYDSMVKPETAEMLKRLYIEIQELPVEEQNMLYHAACNWEGNTHALIQAVGMYISLNKHDRSEVSFMCLHQYEEAQKAGRLTTDKIIDSDFIEKEWLQLLKK